MKTRKIISKAVTLFLLTIFLISCGSNKSTTTGSGSGSGSGSTTSGVTLKTGVFLDSKVAGMSYVSGGQSGDTDANGGFTYEDGNTVTFKVGDITIGTASGSAVMTPVTLVPGAKDPTDPTVTNITRFLMTISDNGDPNNGIVITPAIKAAAAGKSVNFNVDTTTFTNNTAAVITTLTDASTTGEKTLVTVGDAQKHLANTLTISSIAVTPANPTITSGAVQQFKAIGTYGDGSTVDITSSVTWSSSDTNIATIYNNGNANVDSNGHITGLAKGLSVGSTTITASLNGISGTTTLTVTAATLSSIAVTPDSHSIASGAVKQFTATGTYSDGTTQDITTSVTWSSSDTTKATISNALKTDGLASGVSAGTTTITAALNGINGTTTLTVTGASLSSIAITPANTYVVINKTLQLTATGTFSDGTTQDITTTITWSSSDSAKATISNASGSNGLAAGVGVGSATITGTLSSISGNTTLTVIAPVTPSIASGYYHTIALKSDGTVWAWGWNYFGMLGNSTNIGTNNPNPTPTQVSGLTGVTAIAGGNSFTVALKSDGTVWAWGNNYFGQLGNLQMFGTNNPNPAPLQASISGVTAIATGANQALALKLDGTVWAWGSNDSGQLGNSTNVGTSNPNPTPVQVSGLTGVTAIASSSFHNIALKSDGTVWAWGNNYFGQLGISTNVGTANPNPTPTQVSISGVTAIAEGQDFSIALKSNGTVWAWGRNSAGQLGNGTNVGTINPNPTPTQVSGLTGVTAIAGGGYNIGHTIALKSDGTVWTWGDNSLGELGNGTTTNSPITTPVQASISGVTAIASGNVFTVALKSDGTIWAWGDNGYGELGNNSTTNSSTPVQVLGAGGVGYLNLK